MSIQPLLNRVVPHADETLLSWLARLAQRNYCSQGPRSLVRQVLHVGPGTFDPKHGNVNGIRDLHTLQAIAQLGGLSLTEVYNCTLHRLGIWARSPDPSIHAEARLFFQLKRPPLDLYSARFGWCPRCVAESQYVRLHWHVPVMTGCTAHRCWLAERCPGCEARLDEADVIEGSCLQCGFHLARAKTPAIPAADPLLQFLSVLTHWIYGLPVSEDLGLPDVPVSSLVQVLVGLYYAAQRAGNGWALHNIPPGIPVPDLDIMKRRSVTLVERGCLSSTAFRGLLNWPRGLFAFLDAYRARPAPKEDTGLRREFGTLYISWLMRYWLRPELDFVQAAFNDYLVEHVPANLITSSWRTDRYPELRQRVDYLPRPDAARYLQVSPFTVTRLVQAGQLHGYHFEKDESMWLSRSELEALRQKWEQFLTMPEVARLLGISPEYPRVLMREQLLREVSSDEGPKFQITYIHRASVQELIHALKKHTRIQRAGRRSVSLAEVYERHATLGFGWPQALKRICSGSLPAYHPSPDLFPLTALWFLPQDVADLSRQVKDDHGWMDLTETEACLGLGRKIVQDLIDSGLLHPVQTWGQKQCLRRDEVLALQSRAVPAKEAAAMFHVRVDYMLFLARQKVLSPISGPGVNNHGRYLFDRQELQNWQAECVLYHELVTLFGKRATVNAFMKAYHIEPIAYLPTIFRREEVMAARADWLKTKN